MVRLLGVSGVFLLMAPAFILGQTPKKGKTTPATKQEYTLLKSAGEVMGKLASVDTASTGNKAIVLDVPYQFTKMPTSGLNTNPNRGGGGNIRMPRQPNYQSQYASLQRQYQQAMTTKNPLQREQKLAQVAMRMQQLEMQMANAQMRLASAQMQQQMRLNQRLATQANRIFGAMARNTVTAYKQFQLNALDTIVVRRLNPPPDYDDKGNPKKYSKQELDKLRGKDKSAPGYEASFLDLQVGQTIKVYLAAPTKASKKSSKGEAKITVPDDDEVDVQADKKKKGAAADPAADLPQVRMIVILAERIDANAGQNAPPAGKKAK